MKTYKVLFILENCFMSMGGKLKYPVYPVEECNLKNATFARIIPYFKDTNFEIWFGETTPYVATNNKQKFEIDLKWLKKTIEYENWFAVIACCKKAEQGLNKIGFKPFMSLPHPISWKWRKQIIIDCVNELNKKKENEKI